MSETPRTEQVAQTGVLMKDGGYQTERQDWIHAGFARQLERELAEAEAELERRQAKYPRAAPKDGDAHALVQQQALDEGLWFAATTAPEAYLQAALRKLHAAVEGSPIDSGCAQVIERLREHQAKHELELLDECRRVTLEEASAVCELAGKALGGEYLAGCRDCASGIRALRKIVPNDTP